MRHYAGFWQIQSHIILENVEKVFLKDSGLTRKVNTISKNIANSFRGV